MNNAQILFTLFFAIFWGTSASSWPRWKPFHWTLVPRLKRVAARVGLSMLVLNVSPVIVFIFILSRMSGNNLTPLPIEFGKLSRLVIPSIVPAFSIFGLYRIWISVIEACPTLFYYTAEELPKKIREYEIEPTIETLKLSRRNWTSNFVFGLLYIAISIFVPIIWPPL